VGFKKLGGKENIEAKGGGGGGRSWECVLFEEGDMGTEHTNIEYIWRHS